ncbi:MAG TPA: ABC transporter permease [Terriglobales bacterium]
MKLRFLLFRRRLESEMSEEMESHLELRIEDLERHGLSEADARRQARVEFGALEARKEEARAARGLRWVDEFAQDLRFGLRSIRKAPGYCLAVVITLALGIGANSAIFSAVNSVLLQPLPFAHSDQLVRLFTTRGAGERYPASGEDFLDWQAQNRVFSGMSLFTGARSMNASGAGAAEMLSVASTEANYFQLLGVPAAAGRTFAPGEDQPGRTAEVVISAALAQRHFGGAQAAVGRRLELNFEPYTVVGVMPAGFNYPEDIDAWTPLTMTVAGTSARGKYSYRALGRLKPGVSVAQANADMEAIAANLARAYPTTNARLSVGVVPLKQLVTQDSRTQLLVLFGAVGLVLLIACANVASLTLSRAEGRRREFALRAALGAGRPRVVRQLLTEGLLLSLLGGGLGVAAAAALIAGAGASTSLPLPRIRQVQLDGHVLLFTAFLSLLCALIFGATPARGAADPNLPEALKAGGRGNAGAGRQGLRRYLVIAEIAITLALTVAAGLLLRSFAALRHTDLGVSTSGIVTAAVMLPDSKYTSWPQRRAFYDQLDARLNQAPGVISASLSQAIPLEGSHSLGAKLPGDMDPNRNWVEVDANYVTPDYFRTYGVPLLQGRTFSAAEMDQGYRAGMADIAFEKTGATDLKPRPEMATVAVINRALANALWPGQNSLGKVWKSGVWPVTVVGIAAQVSYDSITGPPQPEAYFPITSQLDNTWYPAEISIHTRGSAEAAYAAMRSAVGDLDPALALFRARSMDTVVADNMTDTRLQTTLLGFFSGLGILLSLVGVYGVMAFFVTQRVGEFGVRVALGARPSQILALVLRQVWKLVLPGIAVGVPLALGFARLLGSELHGVRAADPLILILTAVLLGTVALAACLVPAMRALRVDPLTALRQE